MADDFKADIEELRHLQSIAKSPRILSFLSSHIHTLEQEGQQVTELNNPPRVQPLQTSSESNNQQRAQPLQTSSESNNQPRAQPLQTSSESNNQPRAQPLQTFTARSSDVLYTTLGSFSWDQENEKVKIYISLEGVNQEQVVSNFQPWSFDVKFHDIQGKNYRCAVPKLNKAIVPEKCRLTLKPHRVIITLQKAERGSWPDLYYKEDKLKPNLDSNKDPMAGIMDLMKNMYDEGDEDMKRTIAKAWSEARSGKKPDPLSDL